MDGEYYKIEAIFEVAMTMHNYERGNLYMQSEFRSYKNGIKPLTLARSGFLDPKGALSLNMREIIGMIPFSSYFLSCEQTQ